MNQEQVARHIKELEKIFDFLSVDDIKNGRFYISSEDFPTAIQLIRERVLAIIPLQLKESIDSKILLEESKLDEQDAEGYIWLNKFREFIKEI